MAFKNVHLYNEQFYQNHVRLKQQYKNLSDWIFNNCYFKTYLEVGCGNAFISEFLNQAGKDIKCTDYSNTVTNFIDLSIIEKFTLLDMTIPILDIDSFKSDLVTCFEVAEHIDNTKTDEFVGNLTKLTTNILLFSADGGSQGDYHCNLKTREEWINILQNSNFRLNKEMTSKFQNEIGSLNLEIEWFARNFIFFERN